jgi:hypothetical protein
MSDGAHAIRNAALAVFGENGHETDSFKHLMCYFHVIKNIREKYPVVADRTRTIFILALMVLQL